MVKSSYPQAGSEVLNMNTQAEAMKENKTPSPLTEPGVCLTFDDRNVDDWEAMLPVFEKYGTHVTFFISGPITEDIAVRLKAIEAKGHSIGAHGMIHDHYLKCVTERGMTPEEYAQKDSLAQMADFHRYGLHVTSFACPMSSRDERLDEILKQHFRHIRTGIYPKEGERVADRDDAFVPLADVPNHFYFNGKGIDKYPCNTQQMIDEVLERAAARRELFVFYAHRITQDAVQSHHIEPVEVERILKKGKELGLRFYSFDELP